MRLFKRQKSTPTSPCPRCSQLVSVDEALCPMCGWDQADAYQGPTTPSAAPADTGDEVVAGLFDPNGNGDRN